MRLLVCGGREFGLDYDKRGNYRPQGPGERLGLREVLDEWDRRRRISVIIEGEADGADTLARSWAHMRRGIEVASFPVPQAEWKAWVESGRRGRSPGSMRNERMLREGRPDAVLAFPGGTGTDNMVEQAVKAGVPTAREVPAGVSWQVVRVQTNHAVAPRDMARASQIVVELRTLFESMTDGELRDLMRVSPELVEFLNLIRTMLPHPTPTGTVTP